MENPVLRFRLHPRRHYQFNHFRKHGPDYLEFELEELRIPRIDRSGQHGHEKYGYAEGATVGCCELLAVHPTVPKRSARVRVLLPMPVAHAEK